MASALIEMQITGAKEIQAALLSVGKVTGKAIVRKAVRAGGNVILAAARSRLRGYQKAPRLSSQRARTAERKKRKKTRLIEDHFIGLLRRSLGVFHMRGDRKGLYSMTVGVRPSYSARIRRYSNRSKGGKKHWYPAAVEYGHPKAPAKSYLRWAFDNRKGRAIEYIENALWRGINAAWLKGRRTA